jgi:lipoprotein-releasing system ATP-binding protein
MHESSLAPENRVTPALAAVIVAEQIAKNFATPRGVLEILKNCSLSVRAGETIAVMGPSGSGKSTLLNILGTLEPPSGGRLIVGGVDPFALSEPKLASFRNKTIGFVFQDHHLLPHCSVLENVLVPTLAGDGAADQSQRARDLLDRVGLDERLEHRPAELSGGEQQRASIARALINRPAVILADEPTGNLDRKAANNVAKLLIEMAREEQTALIVVTHARSLADQLGRRYELSDGELNAVSG